MSRNVFVSGLYSVVMRGVNTGRMALAYSSNWALMRSLKDKSRACDPLVGNTKPDSSMLIEHRSNMSSSHGTEVTNSQHSLQVARSSSLTGIIWSSVPHRWDARYMTLGIPLGTLVFVEGRMRWAFQTSLISFRSSCKYSWGGKLRDFMRIQ